MRLFSASEWQELQQKKRLSQADRWRIVDRQKSRCFYCDQSVLRREVMDHLMPRSRGGKDNHENRVLACQSCDKKKANRLPTTEEMKKQRALLKER